MLQEKGQRVISVIVSKIDLSTFIQRDLEQRIINLCKEYGFIVNLPIFFTSTKTGDGIQELKSYMDDISKKR